MYIKGTGNIENLFFKRNHVRDTASNQIFQILAFCQVHWFCLYYVSNPPTFVHFQCPYSYKKLSDNMSPSLAACYIDCCLFKLVSLYKDMSRFTFKKNHFILLNTSNDIPWSWDKTKPVAIIYQGLLLPLPFQHPLSLYTHPPLPPWFPDCVTRIWPLLCVSGPLLVSDLWMCSSCSIAAVFSLLNSLRSLLKGHLHRQDCTHCGARCQSVSLLLP